MITVFLLSLIVITLAVLGMAVGILLGRAPLSGSCGGLAQLGFDCDVCEKPCAKKRRALAAQQEDL